MGLVWEIGGRVGVCSKGVTEDEASCQRSDGYA